MKLISRNFGYIGKIELMHLSHVQIGPNPAQTRAYVNYKYPQSKFYTKYDTDMNQIVSNQCKERIDLMLHGHRNRLVCIHYASMVS